jgi:hypothetical protein
MWTRFIWLQIGWSGCRESDRLLAVSGVFSDRSKVRLIILKNKGMDLHRQVLAIIVPSVLRHNVVC